MHQADKLWLIVDDTLHEGAPEDLVLNRQFARVFEGTKLHFDDSKGEFYIRHREMLPIKLAGEGKTVFWTKKALERLGFAVQKEENVRHVDIDISDGASSLWTCNLHGKQLQFTSIYELSKYLTTFAVVKHELNNE